MAIKSQKPAPKPATSPVTIAIAAAALIAFFAILAYMNFGPRPVPKDSTVANPKFQWIVDRAKELKGDFSKLTPDEQAKVQQVMQGKGETMFNFYYRQTQQQ